MLERGEEIAMFETIMHAWQSYINREYNERMQKLDDRLAEIDRTVMKRFSRGNVATQWGFYTTEEDLEELRHQLRDARF